MNSSSNSPASHPPPLPKSPEQSGGCAKFIATGCLGMVVGSIFTVAVEIAGAASLLGKVSEYFSSSSSSTSTSTPSFTGTDISTSSPDGNPGMSAEEIRRNEDYEFYRRKRMEKEKEEAEAEEREKQDEMEAKRQQALEEAHEKLATPEWQ